MESFYYLVTVFKQDFPGNDYKHILVAFDDEQGLAINSRSIEGFQLKNFIEKGENIHYEAMFLIDKRPVRVVYWAYSEERGWCERVEHKIN
jgi:hypothetical protein